MFLTETHLMRHIKNHDTKKNYNCPQCPKTFRIGFQVIETYIQWSLTYDTLLITILSNSSNRDKHFRAVHSTIKPYKCPECDYACADPTNLRMHLIRHTKEARFKCEICGKEAKMLNEMRNHYFSKHDILKKGKLEKQPTPITDKMYKEALAASNLKAGGTIFNMIEGLEAPTHDRIGRPINNEKRKRTLAITGNKETSDSDDENIPLAVLASQSGGRLPWEEPEKKKKCGRKKKVIEVKELTYETEGTDKNNQPETAIVPIEDPPSVQPPVQPPTQTTKKVTRKSTRRSGRAKAVKNYIEDLDEDEENDEELLDILNAAQQKLDSKRTKQSPNKKGTSDQSNVSQPLSNLEHSGQANNAFHFGACHQMANPNSLQAYADPYPPNPFNISQLLQGHLTPTPPVSKALTNMMTTSTLHDQSYSSTTFQPTQASSHFTLKPNLSKSTVSQPVYGPLFDFEIDL